MCINMMIYQYIGESFTTARAKGFNYALSVTLENRAALEAYGPHPNHQLVAVNYIKPIITDIMAVDLLQPRSSPAAAPQKTQTEAAVPSHINTHTRNSPMAAHAICSDSNSELLSAGQSYPIFNWRPNPDISRDENYLDLLMLVTRNSTCKQGSMACFLIEGSEFKDNDMKNNLTAESYISSIISCNNNTWMYRRNHSDVHAEICAISSAARRGVRTDGCCAFITMPPCKKCFSALVEAGVQRIVSRFESAQDVLKVAQRVGIEMVFIKDTDVSKARRLAIVKAYNDHTQSQTQPDACVPQAALNTIPPESDIQQDQVLTERKKRKAETVLTEPTSKQSKQDLITSISTHVQVASTSTGSSESNSNSDFDVKVNESSLNIQGSNTKQ